MKQLTLPHLNRNHIPAKSRRQRTSEGWFRLMRALVDRSPDLREKLVSVTTNRK